MACGLFDFPDQVLNMCLLQWKDGVLTTGLPGNSLPGVFTRSHPSTSFIDTARVHCSHCSPAFPELRLPFLPLGPHKWLFPLELFVLIVLDNRCPQTSVHLPMEWSSCCWVYKNWGSSVRWNLPSGLTSGLVEVWFTVLMVLAVRALGDHWL